MHKNLFSLQGVMCYMNESLRSLGEKTDAGKDKIPG